MNQIHFKWYEFDVNIVCILIATLTYKSTLYWVSYSNASSSISILLTHFKFKISWVLMSSENRDTMLTSAWDISVSPKLSFVWCCCIVACCNFVFYYYYCYCDYPSLLLFVQGLSIKRRQYFIVESNNITTQQYNK